MLSQLKRLGLAVGIILSFHYAKAQKTEPLTFNLPKQKVTGSLYNKVTLIDIRPDTLSMGGIQTGAFNRQAIVVAKEPLKSQLNNILAALIDNTAKSQELALQLRFVNFTEFTGGFTERGYFFLKAQLYLKTNDGYRKINTIDTVAPVSAAMDVSNALLRKGSETLSNFIAANLTRKPSNYTYSYNDIEKADSIEKSRLAVYNTDTFVDGVYLTYKAFSDQTPDWKIRMDEGDTIQKNNVKMIDQTGKLRKVKAGVGFAIVYKGVAYISTTSGYYILTKRNKDFFFTGKVQSVMQRNTSNILVASKMYGAVDAAMAGAIVAADDTDNSISEFKVNYETGQFIKMKERKSVE